MSSLSLHATASLQATMSPRLQRAVRLLQMSSQDFARVVRDALDSNPFLEQEEGGPVPGEVAPEAQAQSRDDGGHDGGDYQSWGVDGGSRLRYSSGDGSVFDTLAQGSTLAAHLLGQLNLMPLPERDRMLAAAVVLSLDDDGYLRAPLEELGQGIELRPAPEPDEWLIALRLVQALEPAGVAARSVAECLALQLPAIACAGLRALAGLILRDHLAALAARDVRGLSRRLGREMQDVEAACAAIRRLDPRPGWRYSQSSVQYVTPDVVARKVRGRWTAVLNESVVPRVRLNRGYVDLFQRHRNGGHAELGAHLQEARWTVRNVEQRFSTILSVAQAILKRQQHFLAYGAMAMKPLALREIASEVGVHESTVSRVTNNKFLATPCGVFELKYFFSRGLATASGGECSPTAIRGLIQVWVAAEPAGRPLSDVDIARQLDRQGLRGARRTVTKYRQLLRIEPAERRRASANAAARASQPGERAIAA
jgi:RNA polymerase sigma-54 factor